MDERGRARLGKRREEEGRGWGKRKAEVGGGGRKRLGEEEGRGRGKRKDEVEGRRMRLGEMKE